jgi:large subunit ribosomal protein L15
MKLNELVKSPETKARKRVGRGIGSGTGKTAGTGENGQKSRSGVSISAWFEGGQTPLYRRLPKRGFNCRNTKEIITINISMLEKRYEDGADVTIESLMDVGLITNPKDGVKILGNGELTKKLNVKVNAYSATAKEKIEALGGKAEVI